MRDKVFIMTFLLPLFVSLVGFGIPKGILKKVEKEIEKTFEVEDFSLQPFVVDEALNKELPARITGSNFYMINKNDVLLGYAYVDQAPSKTAEFDYLVLFDKELKVIRSKVLIYREEYGGEIGSNRWLRQFEGKTGSDRVSAKTNIDAISGATISVRSMTKSMDNLLQTIGKLQQMQLL